MRECTKVLFVSQFLKLNWLCNPTFTSILWMMINYLLLVEYKNDSINELEEYDKIKKKRRLRSGRAFRRYNGKMKIIFFVTLPTKHDWFTIICMIVWKSIYSSHRWLIMSTRWYTYFTETYRVCRENREVK